MMVSISFPLSQSRKLHLTEIGGGGGWVGGGGWGGRRGDANFVWVFGCPAPQAGFSGVAMEGLFGLHSWELSWGDLRGSWGGSWGDLEGSWGSWGDLGGILRGSGCLGGSWEHLVGSWGVLRGSWRVFFKRMVLVGGLQFF